MDRRQIILTLRTKLKALTYGYGADEKVFGNAVFASHEEALSSIGRTHGPFCLLSAGGLTQDAENPSLYSCDFTLETLQWNRAGHMGQGGLVGANQTGGSGSSKGTGLLEFEAPLAGLLYRLNEAQGFKPPLLLVGSDAVTRFGTEIFSAVGTRYRLRTFTTLTATYAPVPYLTSEKVSTVTNLYWALPVQIHGYDELILRKSAVSTPATITDGTGLTIVEASGTYAEIPGAGIHYYSMFVSYNSGANISSAMSTQETN